MISVLKKIITSHRFALIILLLIQCCGFLCYSRLQAWLGKAWFTGSSIVFGILLLATYFNKEVGVNDDGQQGGEKLRGLITLIGGIAIAFIFYLLYRHLPRAEQLSVVPGSIWLAVIIWTISFCLLMIRSMKFNSALYHLLFVVCGTGTALFLSLNSGGVNGIALDTTIMFAAYYMLLVLSFNINSPLIRGVIMGICLAVSGFNAVFWLAPILLVLWLNEPKRSFYRMIISLAVVVAGIYAVQYSGMDFWYLNDNAGISAPVSMEWGILMLSILIILYFRVWKLIHYRIFLMGAFKICIALLFLLNRESYHNLMLIDLFVSIAIFAETGKYHFAGKIKKNMTAQLLA